MQLTASFYFICPFQQQEHQHDGGGKIHRQKAHSRKLCQQAKERRKEQRAHIGKAHLNANNGLGLILPKDIWGGVHNAGINRRTAKTHQHQAYRWENLSRQEQANCACRGNGSAKADHSLVPHLVCHRANTALQPGKRIKGWGDNVKLHEYRG